MRSYPRRIFGLPGPQFIDRNAAARIMTAARAYNAQHRGPDQHIGPLTRCTLEVLAALIFRFGVKSGVRFPSLEAIAIAANCHRDTVMIAITALAEAQILTIVRRLKRQDGKVLRDSNAYLLKDSKSESAARPPQGFKNSLKARKSTPFPRAAVPVTDPDPGLEAALARLGSFVGTT
jgi:DNA-binding transcriptional regulator YhcF (GntR family)